MRVVAGTHRGRRLHHPGADTRPTADRVREALFSILGTVEGDRVLDLYAGSGALGIEALSRGAREAVFVDQSRPATRAIERTLAELGLAAEVHRTDALAHLRRAAGGPGFDLLFLDPPYDQSVGPGGELASLISAVLQPNALIVTESHTRRPLELPFELRTERTYGQTRIAIHRGPVADRTER